MANMFGFYSGEATQSVVDPVRMRAYVVRMQHLIRFKADLTALQQAVLTEQDGSFEQASARACLVAHLQAWAKRRAMLGHIAHNDPMGARQAALEIAWATVAVAHAYDVATAGQTHDGEPYGLVRDWIGALAEVVQENFDQGQNAKGKWAWLAQTSNQLYWAGAAVGAASAVTGSKSGAAWAAAKLDRALAATGQDGAMPAELARGHRAVHYQLFALAAVAMLVRQGDAAGRVMNRDREARLEALGRFSLTLVADPALAEKRTGLVQERKAPDTCGLALLLPHFRRTQAELAQAITASLKANPPKCAIIALPPAVVLPPPSRPAA